ncbi:UNVERIFIED_CONTAM: hypothetical protein HDU68_001925 [Siphonaria sp. JEL0065]|nr:hypothetical protein HDU68_001925 [Siphonaria sp. JEL0065]
MVTDLSQLTKDDYQSIIKGGEYGAAVAYIAEHALSQVMATASCLILRTALSVLTGPTLVGDFPSSSLLLIGVSLYARSKLLESPIFTQAKEAGKIKPANFLPIFIAIVGTCIGQGVLAQLSQPYPLTFLINLGVPLVTAYTILLIPCLVSTSSVLLKTTSLLLHTVTPTAPLEWVSVSGSWSCVPQSRTGYLPPSPCRVVPHKYSFHWYCCLLSYWCGCYWWITGVVAISTVIGNMYGGLLYPIAVSGVSGLVGIFFCQRLMLVI